MARKKLSNIILEDLKKRILVGEYHVNEKLPTERELAQQYDTSRIPVREALQQLSEMGIVQTTPGSGTIVISPGNAIYNQQEQTPYMEDDTILRETIHLRRLIESEAARQAAHNRCAEDIKEIQSALFNSINEIRKLKAKESNSFFQADVDFHKAITRASHNPFLMECLDSIPYLMANHQFWSLKYTTPRDEVVSYHTQIYESILDENGEKAYTAMSNHLSRVENLLIRKSKKRGHSEDEDMAE